MPNTPVTVPTATVVKVSRLKRIVEPNGTSQPGLRNSTPLYILTSCDRTKSKSKYSVFVLLRPNRQLLPRGEFAGRRGDIGGTGRRGEAGSGEPAALARVAS
eukprot:6213963-Pleurochrysis_carterae.AAC.1